MVWGVVLLRRPLCNMFLPHTFPFLGWWQQRHVPYAQNGTTSSMNPQTTRQSPWGGLCRARVGLQAKRCHTLMPLVPRMFTQVRRDCIVDTDLLLIYVFFPSVHQQPVLSKITSGHYDLSTKSKTLQCILMKASSWAIPRKGEAGNILWGKMPLNSKHLHTD